MSSGERPIGAVKGKQPNTEALCHPPPPPVRSGRAHEERARGCYTHSVRSIANAVHDGGCSAGGGRSPSAKP